MLALFFLSLSSLSFFPQKFQLADASTKRVDETGGRVTGKREEFDEARGIDAQARFIAVVMQAMDEKKIVLRRHTSPCVIPINSTVRVGLQSFFIYHTYVTKYSSNLIILLNEYILAAHVLGPLHSAALVLYCYCNADRNRLHPAPA